MKKKEIPAATNSHEPNGKSRAIIALSGQFSKKTNYVFEAYRQAVRLNVNGYIKVNDPGSLEIVIEAKREFQEQYIQWLKDFLGDSGIRFNIEKTGIHMNYKEFRIIHSA